VDRADRVDLAVEGLLAAGMGEPKTVALVVRVLAAARDPECAVRDRHVPVSVMWASRMERLERRALILDRPPVAT